VIHISSKADYPKLDTLPPTVAQHIKHHCNTLLKDSNVPDLHEVGDVFFLEKPEDIQNHTALGLSEPLEQTLNEMTEKLIFKGKPEPLRVVRTVFVLNNNCAIDVFVPENLITPSLQEHLYKVFDGETIIERKG